MNRRNMDLGRIAFETWQKEVVALSAIVSPNDTAYAEQIAQIRWRDRSRRSQLVWARVALAVANATLDREERNAHDFF